MTTNEKLEYGNKIIDLYNKEKEADEAGDYKKSAILINQLHELSLINPEYFRLVIHSEKIKIK